MPHVGDSVALAEGPYGNSTKSGLVVASTYDTEAHPSRPTSWTSTTPPKQRKAPPPASTRAWGASGTRRGRTREATRALPCCMVPHGRAPIVIGPPHWLLVLGPPSRSLPQACLTQCSQTRARRAEPDDRTVPIRVWAILNPVRLSTLQGAQS